MKVALLLVCLVVIAFSYSHRRLDEYKEQGYDILEHFMGQFQIKYSDSETHIIDTGMTVFNTPSLKESIERESVPFTKKDLNTAIITCSKGAHSDYFKWLAWPMGVVGNKGDSQTISLKVDADSCFESITLTYTKTSSNSYTLEFVGSKFHGVLCSNIVQIASAETFHRPIVLTLATPKHTIKFENQSDIEMTTISKWGLRIYQTCDKVTNLIKDVKMTAQLFVGGLSDNPDGEGIWNSKPTQEQVAANLEFLQQGTGYEWQKRQNPVFVDLDKHYVKSGDVLLIIRFDGVDELISWGAGGRVGHTCVALELNGEMHVVESQDGWYWPKHGIQRNTWEQWKEWAKIAGFQVILVPLSDEKRAIFNKNLEKAVAFFESVEGLPYGYHNFVFGWLDDVAKNVPPITTMDYIYVLFSQLEKVDPALVTQFLGEALNKRLGTTGLNLVQIVNTMSDRGMTLEELFAIPEQDDWVYSDGKSMVCCSFIVEVFKAAGLFGDVTVQGTEFTPRDLYQLNFYNTTAVRPHECMAADPHLPYCQIMGEYTIDIATDLWSTVTPYQNMFEKCPSVPPLYERDTSVNSGC